MTPLSRLVRETIVLRDGRKATLRAITPKDAPGLIDLHNHLSFEAQYFRFFGPKPQLTEAEAEYLARVDYSRRFAIVAEAETDEGRKIVGVGRFDVNEPGIAEAAIVIRDDFQHAGLGTELLNRMREVGKGAGLKAFAAEILAENTRMIDLLKAMGVTVDPSPEEESVVRVEVPLDAPVLLKTLKTVAEVAEGVIARLPGREA